MGTGGSRFGAGRPGWRRKCERLLRLDVRVLARRRLLAPEMYFSWAWSRGEDPAGNISIQTGADNVRLGYTWTPYGSDPLQLDELQPGLLSKVPKCLGQRLCSDARRERGRLAWLRLSGWSRQMKSENRGRCTAGWLEDDAPRARKGNEQSAAHPWAARDLTRLRLAHHVSGRSLSELPERALQHRSGFLQVHELLPQFR